LPFLPTSAPRVRTHTHRQAAPISDLCAPLLIMTLSLSAFCPRPLCWLDQKRALKNTHTRVLRKNRWAVTRFAFYIPLWEQRQFDFASLALFDSWNIHAAAISFSDAKSQWSALLSLWWAWICCWGDSPCHFLRNLMITWTLIFRP
jgi:hypothetical protein